MNGSNARRGCEIKAQMVYESLTGIFGSLSLKRLCFSQSFHCLNFYFFLSHCTSACTIYVLFIILIADSVCSFFIFIIISTKFFSLLLVHIHLCRISFFVPFFSIPFAVSEQLVFFSLLFSTCQDSHSQHILSELYLLILHIFSSSTQIVL